MEARWYQNDCLQSVFDYAAQSTEPGLIALPTGTGKGFVIAEFVRRVMMAAPQTRVMMLTHVKELIKQNANKLTEVWPLAPLGVYSAGLGSRVVGMPITFAGVASVYKNMGMFGHIDILIIDEAHLLSPDSKSMYQGAIAKMRAINPRLFILGLTATAYRMGQGNLTDGEEDTDAIFKNVIFDMTDIKGFNRLIADGFLCPLYPKKTEAFLDLTGVGIVNGDYNKREQEKAVDKEDLIFKCLQEMVYYGGERNHWMIFAAGVNHANHITDMLINTFGIQAASIHSKNSDSANDKYIESFKNGDVRCAVNVNKLTTGFDFPAIDLLGHMRKTLSAGLWVQMNGRGTRPSIETGKRDCLALDFARNTATLGPINDPKKPRPKGQGGGDAPIRICPQCSIYNPASARVCFACGYEFSFLEKLTSTASEEELIRGDAPIIETFKVTRVFYDNHQKRSTNDDGTVKFGAPCMKITYLCGMKRYCEWVFLDAPYNSQPGKRSRDWFRQRHAYEPPTPDQCAPFATATAAALSISSQFKVPKFIRVWTNRPNPEIQSVEY